MEYIDRKSRLQRLLTRQTEIEASNKAIRNNMREGCEKLKQFINSNNLEELQAFKELGVDFSYVAQFDEERCLNEKDYGYKFKERIQKDIDTILSRLENS